MKSFIFLMLVLFSTSSFAKSIDVPNAEITLQQSVRLEKANNYSEKHIYELNSDEDDDCTISYWAYEPIVLVKGQKLKGILTIIDKKISNSVGEDIGWNGTTQLLFRSYETTDKGQNQTDPRFEIGIACYAGSLFPFFPFLPSVSKAFEYARPFFTFRY